MVDSRMEVLLATNRLSARISTSFESWTGSSISRFAILYALSTSSSLPQTEIRSLLGINASAVTRHLQYLEDRGLITRKRVPGDQRNVAVTITQNGMSLIVGCSDKRESLLDTLFEGSGHNQIQVLLATVSAIESRLDQAASACNESAPTSPKPPHS
ncbi:MarR family winged helix-turn-helix transcriptional regulator [Bifidobacterium aquikefiri]|uniref:MarR family winged helix-turn-helix transcriptional regulator n=1 Tax=Bifidobacterium aquikefiri TaxID=1653207 RepID=UPI0039E736B4